MEFLSVKNRTPKSSKNNRSKPCKIVYISNPVKFIARPDQFSAVVQQLTGRHSNAANMSSAHDGVAELFSTVKEDSRDGLIPAKSEIMPDNRCLNGTGGGSSYGDDLEAVFEMFEGKTASEFLISCNPDRFDTYAEAHLGLGHNISDLGRSLTGYEF